MMNPQLPLQGKTALVTGGARGIGAAAAKRLAAYGAKVAVNYVSREEAAHQVVAEIRQAGGEAVALRADVRDAEQVRSLVEQAEGALGPVDILVSNANMAFAMKPVTALSWEEFASKLNDEMKAAFLLTQAVAPRMIERGSGRLIYISSSIADVAAPYMAAHGSAKGALNSYVKHVALELGAYGITANVVSPGLVDTEASKYTPDAIKQQIAELTPLRRVAQPEDVSGIIAFLAGGEAGFITGIRAGVSGGYTMG